MNLAMFQRFAPLLQLGTLFARDLSDDSIKEIASALGAGDSPEFAGFLKALRTSEPDAQALALLGSPTARKLLGSLVEKAQAQPEPLFARCPHCDQLFETEI